MASGGDAALNTFDAVLANARIRAALDGVITIDSEGVVVEWNPAAERIFGYPAADAIGQRMSDLIVPEELRDSHRAGMKRFLTTKVGRVLDQRLEMPAITADGRAITIELTITSFEAGGKQWFTGWARDITEIKRTAEELARSQERFQSIVEHSSDVITILDGQGNWLYTSEAGVRLTGYPKGHDPAGGIFSLLHPDDMTLAVQTLQEVLAGTRGPDDSVELRVLDVNGNVLYFETTGVNLLDDPAVQGIVLHARDVTDRRLAEEELDVRTQQLAGVLGSIQLGVLVEDDRRHVAFVNEYFTELFDSPIAPDELIGLDCDHLALQVKDGFADPDGFILGIQRCISGSAPVGEEVTLADGRVLERDYVPVLAEGAAAGHIWLYRDITDRKQAELAREQLLEAEREARRSIEESQATLEEQNRSLLRLDRLKNELVATVSHELRTPLTSIVSFTQLLNSGDAMSASQREFVATIERNANRLIGLVNDLLLLARLESETFELDRQATDLGSLVKNTVSAHQPASDAKGVAVEVEVPAVATVAVDPVRFEQVLDNLVSNAIKFTPEEGRVTVVVSAGADETVIEVVDTGIGIPQEDQGALFERFHRASNARKQMIPGTGLGLAVCRAIVRLHGGEIGVDSAAGKGSRFWIRLPKHIPGEIDHAA